MKAAIGYNWFQEVYSHPHVFFRQRVAFCSGQEERLGPSMSGNPHGTVGVYLGPNVDKFCQVFSGVGFIPGCNSWTDN